MDARERIATLATDTGYPVYDPGVKPGKCVTPYIVVRQMGTYASINTNGLGYTLVVVICYVPIGQGAPETLKNMTDAVKAVLAQYPRQLRRTGHESPDMIEAEYTALSRSVEYQVQKRL